MSSWNSHIQHGDWDKSTWTVSSHLSGGEVRFCLLGRRQKREATIPNLIHNGRPGGAGLDDGDLRCAPYAFRDLHHRAKQRISGLTILSEDGLLGQAPGNFDDSDEVNCAPCCLRDLARQQNEVDIECPAVEYPYDSAGRAWSEDELNDGSFFGLHPPLHPDTGHPYLPSACFLLAACIR
jgi:hypothetical protein